jgi:hypothetical protein
VRSYGINGGSAATTHPVNTNAAAPPNTHTRLDILILNPFDGSSVWLAIAEINIGGFSALWPI